MVKLRLKKYGREHRPFFRIEAMEIRNQRDGESLENLGFWDPMEKDPAKAVSLKPERIGYWLSVGAQPSDAARNIFQAHGIQLPAEKKAEKRERKLKAKRRPRPVSRRHVRLKEKAARKITNIEADKKFKEEAAKKKAAKAAEGGEKS